MGDPPSEFIGWRRRRVVQLLNMGAAESMDFYVVMGRITGMAMSGRIQTRDETCELAEGLARSRRVLGDDHPSTLALTTSLAGDLRELGEHERARKLDQDTLTHCHRAPRDDHPDTVTAADHLANDLRKLGEDTRAGDRDEWSNSQYRT